MAKKVDVADPAIVLLCSENPVKPVLWGFSAAMELVSGAEKVSVSSEGEESALITPGVTAIEKKTTSDMSAAERKILMKSALFIATAKLIKI